MPSKYISEKITTTETTEETTIKAITIEVITGEVTEVKEDITRAITSKATTEEGCLNKSKSRPYTVSTNDQQQKNKFKIVRANLAGVNYVSNINLHDMSFIADSGATDHIINKALVLHEFEKCPGEVIKSANKNGSADIKIDGKGNLMLYSKIDENKIIYLKNVIAASDISSNLISLRRFAEAGYGIYLKKIGSF